MKELTCFNTYFSRWRGVLTATGMPSGIIKGQISPTPTVQQPPQHNSSSNNPRKKNQQLRQPNQRSKDLNKRLTRPALVSLSHGRRTETEIMPKIPKQADTAPMTTTTGLRQEREKHQAADTQARCHYL
jgi:hypothetical protein